MKIVLGGIEMDQGAPDLDGNIWLCTGLQGWDSAEVRRSMLDYAVRDGQAPTRGSYGSRALVLEGVCKTSDYWGAYNALLAATGDLNTLADLTVTEDVDKSVQVYRAGTPKQEIHVGHFTFNIPLIAPNPIKYGAVEEVTIANGTSEGVANDGNYRSTWVQATTLDGAGNVLLRNVGQDRALTTGANNVEAGTVFDMRRRTVYKDGLNRYNELATTSLWWSLDAGANTIENGGAQDVLVHYRPAWV